MKKVFLLILIMLALADKQTYAMFGFFNQSQSAVDLDEQLKQAIESANKFTLANVLNKDKSLVNKQFNGYTPLYLALKKVQDNTDDAQKYTLTRFVLKILEFNPQENQNVVQLLEELNNSSDNEIRQFSLIVQALHLGKNLSLGLYFAQKKFLLLNDALCQLAQEKIQKNPHVINDVVTINNYPYLLLSRYCQDNQLNNQRILDVMLALKPTQSTLDWAFQDCITRFDRNITSIEKLINAGANINQQIEYGFVTSLDYIEQKIATISSYNDPSFNPTLKELDQIKVFLEKKGAKSGSQIFAREIKIANFLSIDRPTDQASVALFEQKCRDILNLNITSLELALIVRHLVDVGMLVSKKALEDQIKKHPDAVTVLLDGKDDAGNKISYTILDYLEDGLKMVQEFLRTASDPQEINDAQAFKKNCEQIKALLSVVPGPSSSSQPVSGLQKSLIHLKDKLSALKSKLEKLKKSLSTLQSKFVS